MNVTPEREWAVDKARKVFRHGASTTANGEKEKAVAVLTALCRKHELVLHDLDPQFPRRLDVALLRVKIGLPQDMASASGPSDGHQQRQTGPGTGRGTGDQAGSRGSGTSGQQQAGGNGTGYGRANASAAFQDVLFRDMGVAERKRWLQGPMFGQGILRAIRDTGAYTRLLAEARSLNASNVGAGLSEPELMRWFEAVLSRQGSSAPCKPGSRTIFDDLAAYCRAQYLAETEQQRRKAEEARRQAEVAGREREREAAEQRRRASSARRERERKAAADPGGFGKSNGAHRQSNGSATFTRTFEHPAEAQLYLKVAQRRMGGEANLRSLIRRGHLDVEFSGSAALAKSVDSAYRRALHDLQMAASTIRAEAARVRDEAIRRAETAYAQQCEQAFQVAVDRYTP